MQQLILQEREPSVRKETLENIAASKETITYKRSLTSAEIDAESKKLANVVKERAATEAEKASEMKMYNDRIKHLKEVADEQAEVLTNGAKEVSETCYKIINFDTREVGYYNEFGELVKVRKATDADLQLDMFDNAEKRGQAAQLTTGDGAPKALPDGSIEDVEFEEVKE